jgi:hypothetical protein
MRKIKSSQRHLHKTLPGLSPFDGIAKAKPILQMPKTSADQLKAAQLRLIQAKIHPQISYQGRFPRFKNKINYLRLKYFQ